MTTIKSVNQRSITNLVVTILVLICCLTLCTEKASAADDYPYKNANKDVNTVDPWNFYQQQCTSFVAWRLNNNNGVSFHNYYKNVRWGNAENWDNAARSVGISVNTTPAVGAVAYNEAWKNGARSYGHVAWVSAVNGNNVTVEEYNHINKKAYYTRTVNKTQFTGYIHIKDIQIRKFTLSYNANGGSGSMASTTHTYGVNQALRKNTFTKTGHTFGGWNVRRLDTNTWWYRNSSGKGGWYAKGKQPSGYSLGVYTDQAAVGYTADGNNCELYAVWIPKKFTLSYNANGGSGSMASTTHTYGVNQALRKNTFIKSGHTFEGWNVRRLDTNTWWYRNSSGKGGWYAKGKQPSGYSLGVYTDQAAVGYTADGNNCELYAVWNPVYTEETTQSEVKKNKPSKTALKGNPLTVKVKKNQIKYAKLKKKNQTIQAKKALTITKAKGKVTYKKINGNKKISVNSKGRITIKKGLKKGKYKIKVKVRAAGNKVYKPGIKTVIIPIIIK